MAQTGAAVMLGLLLASSGTLHAAPTVNDPALSVELWTTGLTTPTQIAFVAAGDLLVAEHMAGRVARVLGGALQGPALVLPGSDRALGLAVSEDSPPFVFLFVEDPTETLGNRVDRYVWNAGTGTLEGGVTILQLPPATPGSEHDSGALLVAGGFLYVTHGDQMRTTGQLQNDPNGTAPADSSVVLRLAFDGSPAPGNPFEPYCSATTTTPCASSAECPGGEVCRTEVARYWSYGLRNTFGIANDPVTGEIWDTENGADEWDEVNRLPAGTNSGWALIQGPAPGALPTLFDMPGAGTTYREPDLAWFVPTGPTGIAFPHGSSFGFPYDDVLLFGDFNLPSRIYALPLAPARLTPDFSQFPLLQDGTADTTAELDLLELATGFDGRVLDLEFGPDGHLYVPTYTDGRIYRIRGPGRAPTPVPALGSAAAVLLAASLLLLGLGFAPPGSAR